MTGSCTTLQDWNSRIGAGWPRTKCGMTFEQAVQWNEEMLAMFPPKPNRAALDADAKCTVEFRLL